MKLHILSGAEHADTSGAGNSRLHQIDTGRDTIGEKRGFEHARVLAESADHVRSGPMQAVARTRAPSPQGPTGKLGPSVRLTHKADSTHKRNRLEVEQVLQTPPTLVRLH